MFARHLSPTSDCQVIHDPQGGSISCNAQREDEYLQATLLNGMLHCMHQLIHVISCNHKPEQLRRLKLPQQLCAKIVPAGLAVE